MIPAHFGESKSKTTQKDSYDEAVLVLSKMGMLNDAPLFDGAAHAVPDEKTPVPSAGADIIIKDAMKDDKRPLYISVLYARTPINGAQIYESIAVIYGRECVMCLLRDARF